jgi:tetratricopeptide (TPR) repeat protein
MNKENILFGIVGLLAGLIIGFMGANSINKQAMTQMPVAGQTGSMPAGHPDTTGGQGGQAMGANAPEVQAAIEAARNQPDNFDAQMKAASFFYQIQRYDGALEFLTRANKIKPDDYETIVQLGNTNFDADKYEEAEKWYTQALAKKPEDVNVRTDLGLTYMFRNPPDYDKAIKEFKGSLEKEPNHPQTLQNLTVAYTKKGDAANASATLAKLEQMEPSNQAISKLRSDIDQLKTK